MPTIPAGFINVVFHHLVTGYTRETAWTLGLDSADFVTLSAAEIAEEVATIATNTGCPYNAANMLSTWQFTGVTATKQLEEGPITARANRAITGTISSASTAMPPNTAILLKKVTTAGGRRNRGRAFLPPCFPSEQSVSETGVMLSGSLTAMQGYYTLLDSTLRSADYDPVLFHSEAPFTPTPIQSLQISSVVCTQRRRLRR